MTNIVNRKMIDGRKDRCVSNSSELNDSENYSPTRETNTRSSIADKRYPVLTSNVIGANCRINDNVTEDADEVNNDSDTSSSFSLQECMNEFRARRIRRTSVAQHRQDANKNSRKNGQETTELDLINQNLCNKEQERKCKPCQNGFCYCFTSDSGDCSASLADCRSLGGMKALSSRRFRQSKCMQSAVRSPQSERACHDQKPLINGAIALKSANKTKVIKAVSSIEESTKDAPLIHIIQELRENCVISKVKVNKDKFHSFGKAFGPNLDSQKAANTGQPKRKEHEELTPTAPDLDIFSDLDTDKAKPREVKVKNSTNSSEKKPFIGGQLLQKRLSVTKLNYKPGYVRKAPPKPPRTSFSYDDKFSSDSTSSSVREAERFLDIFLEKKGIDVGGNRTSEHDISVKKPEILKSANGSYEKRGFYPFGQKETDSAIENHMPTCPSFSDMEKGLESQNLPFYDKNIRHVVDNKTKLVYSGWNEAKIKDMLNYDNNREHGEFLTTSSQAEPQKTTSGDILGSGQPIGWQMPPKLNLDTVDGVVHHNLASNFLYKNTPVKTKILSPNRNQNNRTSGKKILWSEKLSHLSPWSKKPHVLNNSNRDNKFHYRSRGFLTSSKNKLLRLVSPKKENRYRDSFQRNGSHLRHIGIQTLPNVASLTDTDSKHQQCPISQSPPGSYHSTAQSYHIQHPCSIRSQNNASNETKPASTKFSYSPTVKVSDTSHRKSKFPLKKISPNIGIFNPLEDNEKETYRSFNTELDQDISLSKISYILSNIRGKLEASDQHAVRTFLKAESTVKDSCPNNNHEKCMDKDETLKTSIDSDCNFNEPIYSEIEDNSIHLVEGPDFDNHTCIKHYAIANNPDILYAKVNKCILDKQKFQLPEQKQPIPLATIMVDSMKSRKIVSNFIPLPTLSEPPSTETETISLPFSSTSPLSNCNSLNNVRVMEHNSSPKKQLNFSKSDISLHRSEIFLENLCKSELVLNADLERTRLYKVENVKKYYSSFPNVSSTQPSSNDVSCMPPKSSQYAQHFDSVSYELPEDETDDIGHVAEVANLSTADSNLGLSTIVPPSSHNQSTPKKHSFVTKDKSIASDSNIDPEVGESDHLDTSSSKPINQKRMNTSDQTKLSHSLSMNEVSQHVIKNPSIKNTTALERYKSLKNVLQSSFRKSKIFIREKRKLLSANSSMNNATFTKSTEKQSYADSNLNLEVLFGLSESENICEQIAQTVSICRQIPDLETSIEMVEAERLLLFSVLRRKNQQDFSTINTRNEKMSQKPKMIFFIDDMSLPVQSDVNQDIFFNFFYIVTFECGGVIKSTQSAECVSGTAVFQEIGIEFVYCDEIGKDSLKELWRNAIKCNIFMLRLRKLSSISNEPKKEAIADVVSRFQLQASFTLDARDFTPFEYVHQESHNSDRICIRASSVCSRPLTSRCKSANLSGQILLKGRAEIRAAKLLYDGFLNVQDPYKKHNWNRRWCTLDGIFLYVFPDKNSFSTTPIMSIDLRNSKQFNNYPLTCSPRELCARPRSFYLEYRQEKQGGDISSSKVFFAAETQKHLDDWLNILNSVFDFIATWL